MPIYEYACQQCDHKLDALQKMSDDPLVDCPECGAPALKKMLSAPRFRLKGAGWYETDFKKDNQRNLAGDAPKQEQKTDKNDKNDKKSSGSSQSTAGQSGSGSGASKSGSSGAKAD